MNLHGFLRIVRPARIRASTYRQVGTRLQALRKSEPVFQCFATGLNDTDSLEPPKGHPKPNPPFEYDTVKVLSVKISDDLKWKNPISPEEGVRDSALLTVGRA
jgi:hypothetical protein